MRIINFLIFISFSLVVQAQKSNINTYKNKFWKNLSIESKYQNGYVFGTNDFLRGNNLHSERINSFQVFSLELATQTTGDEFWEQLYNYPSWGIGVNITDFHNQKELGNPVAVYGFFNVPLKRWNKLMLNSELGFGVASRWKSFNPITNQYNVAIGANESFFINAGLDLKYELDTKIDIIAGFSLTHFSNGALKKPNMGINTIAPQISLKYNFYDRPVFRIREIPEYTKENEWLISTFIGMKNVVFDSVNVDILEKYEGVFFTVFGISTTYNRQVSYKSKIGIGMTTSYDGSINAQVAIDDNELDAVDRPLKDKIQLSIYPSYELVLNKMSLVFQPAFYIYRKRLKNLSPVFYQRVGLKYHLTNKFFIGLNLRTYQFHVSDFIEWNMGYRIKWK